MSCESPVTIWIFCIDNCTSYVYLSKLS